MTGYFLLQDPNETESSDSDSEATQKSASQERPDLPTSPVSSGTKTISDLFKRIGGRKKDEQHAKLAESSSSSQRRRRSFESDEPAVSAGSRNGGDQLKTKF